MGAILSFIGHSHVFVFGPFIVVDKAIDATVGKAGFAYFHRGNLIVHLRQCGNFALAPPPLEIYSFTMYILVYIQR